MVMASCYEPYDADIHTDKKVLVVEGLITDEPDIYHIRLTLATPYDTETDPVPVSAATVSVTDYLGHSYAFSEQGNGEYLSEKDEFTGIPGHTYILHITLSDGSVYESDPQFLLPEVHPDSVYAAFDYQVRVDPTSGKQITVQGATVFTDIAIMPDTITHFRFTSERVTQYFYIYCQVMVKCWSFFCWNTDQADPEINLTGTDYSLNVPSVRKHAVCFVDDDVEYFGPVYELLVREPFLPDTALLTKQFQTFGIHNRIVYINQYSLNNESYAYYKAIGDQLETEGKLFDPIAVQLVGNIHCITDPDKQAFGFFEASSVSRHAYKIDLVHLIDGQPDLTTVPYILPPENAGCRLDISPAFWID